jgi:hypothetical protein
MKARRTADRCRSVQVCRDGRRLYLAVRTNQHAERPPSPPVSLHARRY